MNEGIYRVLVALGDGRARTVSDTARAAGEAKSVVQELLHRHPAWVEQKEGLVCCSDKGLGALAREMVARTPRVPSDEVLARYEAIWAGRPGGRS